MASKVSSCGSGSMLEVDPVGQVDVDNSEVEDVAEEVGDL